MAIFIRTRIQSKKAPLLDKIPRMSADEACKYGPYGQGDVPCVVECGGVRREWKSRRAATHFYNIASYSCDINRSDALRYASIATKLYNGNTVASDGIPVVKIFQKVADPSLYEKRLSEIKARRAMLEKLMDEARENGAYDTACKWAHEWNEVSLEIIGWTRMGREMGHEKAL